MSDLHSFKSRLQLVASGENDVHTATGLTLKLGTNGYMCWELILSPLICQHTLRLSVGQIGPLGPLAVVCTVAKAFWLAQ